MSRYLSKFQLAPRFTEEEVMHYLMPVADVIDSHVVEAPSEWLHCHCRVIHCSSLHARHKRLELACHDRYIAYTCCPVGPAQRLVVLQPLAALLVFAASQPEANDDAIYFCTAVQMEKSPTCSATTPSRAVCLATTSMTPSKQPSCTTQ